MKYQCELIQDLLPLYIDDALSDVSRKIVEDHLLECRDCKELLEDIREDNRKEPSETIQIQEQTESYGKKIKKKRKKVAAIVAAAFVFVIAATAMISIKLLSGEYDYVAVDLGNFIEAQEYIEKGWIPECMPQDADHISVVYLLDDTRVNGQFHASEADIKDMTAKLSPATVEDLKNAQEAIDGMYNDVKSTLEKAPYGVTFYQDDAFVYAVSTNGTVYFFGK